MLLPSPTWTGTASPSARGALLLVAAPGLIAGKPFRKP
jgi:hypothetical protein